MRIESDDDNVGATAEYPTTLVHLINMCREAWTPLVIT